MKTKKQIITLEKGEVLDEMSLDLILGGAIDPTTSGENGTEAGSDCDFCNTCGHANNANNGDGIISSL